MSFGCYPEDLGIQVVYPRISSKLLLVSCHGKVTVAFLKKRMSNKVTKKISVF